MPSRLLVKVSPSGVATVVEDGRLDLRTLGLVVSRVRLGRIEPAPDDPAMLELTMAGDPTPVGRFALKPDAVEAEVALARQLLRQPEDDREPRDE